MSGVEFIVGTSIGVAGLLLGFKGAVDGFNLIRDIFASDTGVHFSGVMYHVQKEIFTNWGERMRIEDANNCLLNKESDITKGLVARIITEVLVTQEMVANEYIKKYGIQPAPPLPAGTTVLDAKSQWISHLRRERNSKKQAHRFKWSTGDKQRFDELLKRLTALNDALLKLVRHEIDRTNLVSAIITGLEDASSLVPLSQGQAASGLLSLLSVSAQVKAIVEEDPRDAASRVSLLKLSELDIDDSFSVESGRSIGRHRIAGQPPRQIMVEWKSVPLGTTNTDEIVMRVRGLGAVLTKSNSPEFCHFECLGVLDDEDFARNNSGQRRLGVVYALPRNSSKDPMSLSSILSRKQQRPALGDRIELAFRLASAVSLLHSTNWIHKSLRSDNIFFASAAAITSPYLCGFQYSRPSQEASMEKRPTGMAMLDMYYHPTTVDGWTKIKEIYSLGVVLMEVALWRSVFEDDFHKMSMKEVSEALLKDLNGDFGRDLRGLVGNTFVDVIHDCLVGDFDVPSGNTPEEAKKLRRKFYFQVVERLALCRV
ncbi:hypothetical protein ACHAQH_005007 [Verticillium albo-atrum]